MFDSERIDGVRKAAEAPGLFGAYARFLGVPDLCDALSAAQAEVQRLTKAVTEANTLVSGGICVVGAKGKDAYIRRIGNVLDGALAAQPAERDQQLAALLRNVRATVGFMEDAPELWGNPAADTALLGLRALLAPPAADQQEPAVASGLTAAQALVQAGTDLVREIDDGPAVGAGE